MHAYSRDFNHTAWVHVVLLAIALLAYWGMSQMGASQLPYIKSLGPIARFWVFNTPLTAFSIFILIETWFDRWGWRILSGFRFLHWENFAGNYAGQIRTGEGATHQAAFKIKQTWSHIEIDFESESATSRSFSAAVVKDRLQLGQIELIYNYFALPRRHGTLDAHYGTAMLRLADHGSDLDGNYFTEQDRNSYGTIALSRRPSTRRLWIWMVVLIVLAAITSGGWYYWSGFSR